jgi:hypothetical protein
MLIRWFHNGRENNLKNIHRNKSGKEGYSERRRCLQECAFRIPELPSPQDPVLVRQRDKTHDRSEADGEPRIECRATLLRGYRVFGFIGRRHEA